MEELHRHQPRLDRSHLHPARTEGAPAQAHPAHVLLHTAGHHEDGDDDDNDKDGDDDDIEKDGDDDEDDDYDDDDDNDDYEDDNDDDDDDDDNDDDDDDYADKDDDYDNDDEDDNDNDNSHIPLPRALPSSLSMGSRTGSPGGSVSPSPLREAPLNVQFYAETISTSLYSGLGESIESIIKLMRN